MIGKLETQEIPLGGLAPALKSDDRRPVYLIDNSGNAYTFFKYKGRLVDVNSLILETNLGKKTKEEAIEIIRKGLLYGINQNEAVIFHIGDNSVDADAFLKGASFWEPKQLFRSPEKMNSDWYRSKLMKPDDKDTFGNEGSLYPGEKFIVFVSLTKAVPFGDIAWLKGLEESFKGLTIN